MVVEAPLGVDLNAAAELSDMLVEGRLEPAFAKRAAGEPFGRERAHLGDHGLRVDVGRTEQLQRPRRAAAFAERRSFQHHRPGIGARHVEVRGVGAGIDPDTLAERPAEAGRGIGFVALHLDHAIVDVELEMIDEPEAELAKCQAVAHRDWPCSDEAFPTGAERQSLDRPAGGVGAIEHPHALAVLGRGLEHIKQRGDEGVDAAAEVLKVHQDHVERAHRLTGGASHLAVEAEHRNAELRVGEVLRLHHIVLFVAPEAVLRPEGGGELEADRGERVERVSEVFSHRSGMREQRDTLAFERLAESGVGEEPVDAEFHAPLAGGSSRTKQAG